MPTTTLILKVVDKSGMTHKTKEIRGKSYKDCLAKAEIFKAVTGWIVEDKYIKE